MEARSREHCSRGKAISVKDYECVPVSLSQLLGTQFGPYQRHTTLSSVACLALPFFPHYLTNNTHSDKTLLNIKYVL